MPDCYRPSATAQKFSVIHHSSEIKVVEILDTHKWFWVAACLFKYLQLNLLNKSNFYKLRNRFPSGDHFVLTWKIQLFKLRLTRPLNCPEPANCVQIFGTLNIQEEVGWVNHEHFIGNELHNNYILWRMDKCYWRVASLCAIRQDILKVFYVMLLPVVSAFVEEIYFWTEVY